MILCRKINYEFWIFIKFLVTSCKTHKPKRLSCRKNRRIGDIDTLRKQTEAWATRTNTKQRGVDWQFTIGDARRKLKTIYPKNIE